MYSVIRNNQWCYVDKVKKSDIQVPPRPSNLYEWNGEFWEIINIEPVRTAKYTEVNTSFDDSLKSGVTVSIDAGDILMDAGEYAANKMKNGVELAELNGETLMNIVDFNNGIHLGITIDDALQIAIQQGLDYRAKWGKRAMLRMQIKAATTVQELQGIHW